MKNWEKRPLWNTCWEICLGNSSPVSLSCYVYIMRTVRHMSGSNMLEDREVWQLNEQAPHSTVKNMLYFAKGKPHFCQVWFGEEANLIKISDTDERGVRQKCKISWKTLDISVSKPCGGHEKLHKCMNRLEFIFLCKKWVDSPLTSFT